jgi:UDP-2-acetamido-3-amino-2,3-dideoxy-glucuronate N-acetyltransferase
VSEISDGLPEGVFVHERALCDTVDIGAGTRVWAFAHVQGGAVVGRDCNIGEGAFIEDGARLGDRVVIKNGVGVWGLVTLENDVFAGPHVAFTNDLIPRAGEYRTPAEDWLPTHVLEGACIGANATIVCGTVIGRHALIGAGTVVTHDVPDHAIVVGNPSKVVGWICVCGNRLEGAGTCSRCGRTFEPRENGLAEVTR